MANKSNIATKKPRQRKVVDPMIINARKAEEDNGVLDEALADLEMGQEQDLEREQFDFDTEEKDVVEVRGSRAKRGKTEELSDLEDSELGDSDSDSSDLDDIYAELEEADVNDLIEEDVKGKKKKEPKLKKNGKPKMKLWKKILIGVIVVVLAVVGYAAWYVLTALSKTTSVFEGNPLDILTATPMAKDENGRTNVLVFGTSEDEEGHGGAMLADSILVVSFDQEQKEAKTFSIPRDLWVNYTVAGEETLWCSVGYKGKINAEYLCALRAAEAENGKTMDEAAAAKKSKADASRYFARKISEVTGVNIQYYVAVDWTVLRTVVDTLGGIDVDVWATDDRGISDVCQQLVLPKGMNYGLNGDTTLRLARARGACHGNGRGVSQNYGLSNSNFDREKNQQRIINAIKDKAMNAGVLADPTKVLTMIDALGENVKTNITMSEVRTVLDTALGLKGEIRSIETQKQFTTGMIGSQSSVVPAGVAKPIDPNSSSLYDYSALHKFFQEQLNAKEVVTVDEMNDGDESGESSSEAE